MSKIATDKCLEDVLKRINAITLATEKTNYTQFVDKYKYKGTVNEDGFVLKDILSSTKFPSDTIKGRFTSGGDGKLQIDIELENEGDLFSTAILYAMIAPFSLVISLVIIFLNEDVGTGIGFLTMSIFFLVIFKPKKKEEKDKLIMEKFKEHVGLDLPTE